MFQVQRSTRNVFVPRTKRFARRALVVASVAALVAGMVMNFSLVLASGVNLMLTSDFGFAVAAWSVSPGLFLLSLTLFLGGMLSIFLNMIVFLKQ